MTVWILLVFNQGLLEDQFVFKRKKFAKRFEDWHGLYTKLGKSEYTHYKIVREEVVCNEEDLFDSMDKSKK